MRFAFDRLGRSGNGPTGRASGLRRASCRRYCPTPERMEARELLATTPATAPMGGLATFSDSGMVGDNITNVNRPTFVGDGTAYSVVQVSAIRASSWPTETRYLGSTIVNSAGRWTVVSSYLPDGIWTITTTTTTPGGSPSEPTVLINPLVIDTIAPRVTSVGISADNAAIVAVISDAGSGILQSTATDSRNYTVVPPENLVGSHPALSLNPSDPPPSVSGFYSNGNAYTVRVSTMPLRSGGKPYTFQIRSGGVSDVAGNALDGEYLRNRLPSGNGAPGGNFIARLTPHKLPQPPRAHPRHWR